MEGGERVDSRRASHMSRALFYSRPRDCMLHTHSMRQPQRRLLSTAARFASVPLSSLKSFPPKEVLTSSSSSTFSPEIWSALQPPPHSGLFALAHRIGYGSVLRIPELEQACTHPSVLPLFAKHYPNHKLRANGNLSTLGNVLLGLFASEFVTASYPHLPTRVVKAAVSAYVGPNTCAGVAKEVGAAPLLRWHRTVRLRRQTFFSPLELTYVV
jgi:large subunit ribosomal protein L44